MTLKHLHSLLVNSWKRELHGAATWLSTLPNVHNRGPFPITVLHQALSIMSIGYGAGIASHIAQTVGEDISSSLSGVAQLIAESADVSLCSRLRCRLMQNRMHD